MATPASRIVWRILTVIPIIGAAVVFTFVLIRLLPGDPAAHLASGMSASAGGLAAMRHHMGLDGSIATQLGEYLSALCRGDWGRSFTTGQPVLNELRERLPATLELTFCGFLLSAFAGLLLGAGAALRPGSWLERFCNVTCSVGSSLPSFFVGLLLIHIFYYRLGWVPEPDGRLDIFLTTPPRHTGFLLIDAALAGQMQAGIDAARRLVLPAVTLALFGVPPIARVARSALRRALSGDPVRTVRSLGLAPRTILTRYAFPEAAPAIVTTLGMVLSYQLGASVAVEKVFSWPGISSYALDALASSDYAPLQGFILTLALLFAVLNLLTELCVMWLDPRARHL